MVNILPTLAVYIFTPFSLFDCLTGALAELSCFNVWADLRLKQSRHLQLCFQLYYGLLYTAFCVYSLHNPYWDYPGWDNSPIAYYYKGYISV